MILLGGCLATPLFAAGPEETFARYWALEGRATSMDALFPFFTPDKIQRDRRDFSQPDHAENDRAAIDQRILNALQSRNHNAQCSFPVSAVPVKNQQTHLEAHCVHRRAGTPFRLVVEMRRVGQQWKIDNITTELHLVGEEETGSPPPTAPLGLAEHWRLFRLPVGTPSSAASLRQDGENGLQLLTRDLPCNGWYRLDAGKLYPTRGDGARQNCLWQRTAGGFTLLTTEHVGAELRTDASPSAPATTNPPSSGAESPRIYRCTDAQGRISFGTQPCRNAIAPE